MSENKENRNDKGPKLSRGLKIFIIAGTVFLIGFSVVYYATHNGSSEYYRTQIEPDSNLADKELVVKQDTIRRDTAAADSANKEEEEQAKKVFNSIRGNVRHRTNADDDENTASSEDAGQSTDDNSESATPTENEKTTPAASSSKTEAAPKVEKVE